jgi:hypothetical protein
MHDDQQQQDNDNDRAIVGVMQAQAPLLITWDTPFTCSAWSLQVEKQAQTE